MAKNNKEYSDSISQRRELPVLTPKRIEIKEVSKLSDLNRIYKAIHLSKHGFKKCYPNRKVNSVYFDTIQMNSLEDSIEGSSERTKFRLRWYGTELTNCPAKLEIKNKKGTHSWKYIYDDGILVNPNAKRWDNFINWGKRDFSRKTQLIGRFPSAIVCYDREYYESLDKKIRITVDHALKTFEQISSRRVNFQKGKFHSNLVVTELKSDWRDSERLKDVLRDLPFTPRRFSKYCESIMPQKHH